MLSNLSFLQPLILYAFLSLPILWVILRITPPPPRIVRLPSFKFLDGLATSNHTPKNSPLWLLLLRLLALSLLILGFAGPVLNAEKTLSSDLPPRIIIDNSWAGAANWTDITRKATQLIEEADEREQMVQIALLAEDSRFHPDPVATLTPREALSMLRGLTPQSWTPHPDHIIDFLKQNSDDYHSYILSSALSFDQFETLQNDLVDRGGLDIYTPSASSLPFILKMPSDPLDRTVSGIEAEILAFDSAQTTRALEIYALGDGNRVIARNTISADMWRERDDTLSESTVYTAPIAMELPSELVSKVKRLQVSQQKTAATTYIVDPSLARKTVGIVQLKGDRDDKAYIGTSFYLNRALSPYADLIHASFVDVLDAQPAVMIIPDDIPVFTEQLNELKRWLEKGGVLIRFSGPNLMDATQNSLSSGATLNSYLPVSLRRGGRSMGGDLSWEDAQSLSAFEENSLFYGLPISDDIKIRQMVLAQPGDYLQDRVWANLEDGTPLVTFEQRQNGLIVLFHVSAHAEWSTLPLSGTYVSMLKRIIDLSSVPIGPIGDLSRRSVASLSPVYVINGFGDIEAPSNLVKPVPNNVQDSVTLSQEHPAGLYASSGVSKIINVSDQLSNLALINADNVSTEASLKTFQSSKEQRPGRFLLFLALMLLLIDLIAWLLISPTGKVVRNTAVKALFIMSLAGVLCGITAHHAVAQGLNSDQNLYANDFYLAYVETGREDVDELSLAGLEVLAVQLNRRTSAEPVGVKAIDLNLDSLSFFPIIYWPITPEQPSLRPAIAAKIQNYLDNGGMILFDLQDHRPLNADQRSTDLMRVVGSLNIAPLEIAPEGHAIRRSFYLLDDFSDSYPDNPLWVEMKEDTRIADAGSVLIGNHDWALSWSNATRGNNNHETAIRFGINLVMYALTGNYKTDQVHVQSILERLGE